MGRHGYQSGEASVFAPARFGDVAWWLREDVTLNGTLLASWKDKSGNGRHWQQPNPALQPAWVPNELHGHPSARFDLARQTYLIGPDLSAAGLTGAEGFIVIRRVVDNATAAEAGCWRVGTGSDSLYQSSNVVYDSFGSTVRKSAGSPVPLLSEPRLYNQISVAGEWSNFIHNTQLYTTAVNTVGFAAATLLGKSLGAYYLDGWVSEWLVYSHKLPAHNKAHVQAYFSDRYPSLTVP